MVPLSPVAAWVLEELPRIKGNPWVIPGFKRNRHLADLNHYWDRLRERADLQDVRIHDIRHTFASRAFALGECQPLIGKLLGQRQVQTTARYAHLAQHPLKAAAWRGSRTALLLIWTYFRTFPRQLDLRPSFPPKAVGTGENLPIAVRPYRKRSRIETPVCSGPLADDPNLASVGTEPHCGAGIPIVTDIRAAPTNTS